MAIGCAKAVGRAETHQGPQLEATLMVDKAFIKMFPSNNSTTLKLGFCPLKTLLNHKSLNFMLFDQLC